MTVLSDISELTLTLSDSSEMTVPVVSSPTQESAGRK